MVLYIIIAIFFIIIFSGLLFVLACISCLGLTDTVKKMIYKFMGSSRHDREYVES